jgi:hypothetical protein
MSEMRCELGSFKPYGKKRLEVLNSREQAVHALCNESITDLTLIVEQHSRKHAAALSKLSIEEKSEDTKRCLMKLEKQRGNLQKCVSHGWHSTEARFATPLCMRTLGKTLTGKESLKKTYVVVVRNF